MKVIRDFGFLAIVALLLFAMLFLPLAATPEPAEIELVRPETPEISRTAKSAHARGEVIAAGDRGRLDRLRFLPPRRHQYASPGNESKRTKRRETLAMLKPKEAPLNP